MSEQVRWYVVNADTGKIMSMPFKQVTDCIAAKNRMLLDPKYERFNLGVNKKDILNDKEEAV